MYYIHKRNHSSVVQTDGVVDLREYYAISEELTGKLHAFMPFFELTIEDGEVVDITDDAEARAAQFPELQALKIDDLSATCQRTIFEGIVVNGEHFTLKYEDQIYITNLTAMAQAGAAVSYNPSGGSCRMYTPQEFLTISATAFAHTSSTKTYFNHLRDWVWLTEDTAALDAIYWGAEIPADIMAKITGKAGGDAS